MRYIHFHRLRNLNGCITPLLFPVLLATQEHEKMAERNTHNIKANENILMNTNAAISAVGATAAAACPIVIA